MFSAVLNSSKNVVIYDFAGIAADEHFTKIDAAEDEFRDNAAV